MQTAIQERQGSRQDEFRSFVAQNVEPCAELWDKEQRIPESALSLLAKSGYLGCSVPPELGGLGWDVATFGSLHEAFGKASSSLTGVLTVQAMVSMALLKWGTTEQKRTWIPPLATGDMIGAFALTEAGTGSDIQSVTTVFASQGDHFILNGSKKWISCGQFAGVFLVFGKLDGQSLACLVPRNS